MSRVQRMKSERFLNRLAAERYDVLEDELPRRQCHARGCERQAHSYIVWRIRNLT